MLDLNKSLVSSCGLIDLAATLTAVADAVKTYNSVHENDLDKVAAAVAAVRADYPDARITRPCMVTLTLGKLPGITPQTHGEMTERINDYLDSQIEAGTLEFKKGRAKSVKA